MSLGSLSPPGASLEVLLGDTKQDCVSPGGRLGRRRCGRVGSLQRLRCTSQLLRMRDQAHRAVRMVGVIQRSVRSNRKL